jgi:transcriptional adapter 2-alpha
MPLICCSPKVCSLIKSKNCILSQTKISPKSKSCSVCDKCEAALSEPYVSCAECSELFCLSCFSMGSETKVHRSDHSYTIRHDDFPLFPGCDWTAQEEKKILNLVFSLGVGNWDEIGESMKKPADECRSHFHKFYFDGVFGKRLSLTNKNAYVRHIVPYIMKSNTLDPPRGDINHFICKSMAGYRFARSDFDVPYDNSAESILNDIVLDKYETSDKDMNEVVEEINLAMFRAYNHRLKERHRRFQVVRDHGLILQRKTLAWLSIYSEIFPHHSDLGKMAAFIQISDPTSFDVLMESLKLFFDTKRYLYR